MKRAGTRNMFFFFTWPNVHVLSDVTQSSYSEALTWFHRVNTTNISLYNKQITFYDIPALQQLTDYPRRGLHLFVTVRQTRS